MLKILRAIRFDESDTRVFDHAATPGEWVVSGALEFAALDPARITGKTKQAFANGWLGVDSLGRATFATVGEIPAADLAAVEHRLVANFVAHCGAPTRESAQAVAAAEIAFISELCRDVPINTVFAVRRTMTATGEIKEEFRQIAAPSGEPAHARIWAIETE